MLKSPLECADNRAAIGVTGDSVKHHAHPVLAASSDINGHMINVPHSEMLLLESRRVERNEQISFMNPSRVGARFSTHPARNSDICGGPS